MQGIVTKSTGSWYRLQFADGSQADARLRGALRLAGSRATNPVAVGDRVEADPESEGRWAITSVHERRNHLVRKSVNLSRKSQVIAANIDQAVLIATVSEPVTLYGFMDRFLATAEAYRIPNGKKAVLQYALRSAERGELRMDLGGQVKIAPDQPVQALQGGLDLSTVPSGRYTLELTLAVQDMDPTAYPTQKISFFRWNPGEANEYARLTVDPRWVELLGEGENLRRAVSALYPIASQTERLSIESLSQKDAADSLRWRFTQQFWTKRHPGDALVQAGAYAERVAEVNKKYSSKAVPGYATDRGRIYLQYGPPTLAERRPYENDAYPYEMWQYNTLDVPNSPYQINKIFIFGNFDLAGGNYELIHSSAIGEIQNPRWRITLQKRSYITGDLDQTGANDGEKFGSRLYNNMFFQSGGNN